MSEQSKLKAAIRRAAENLGLDVPREIPLERPKRAEHGDWSTNLALLLARQSGLEARALATRLVEALDREAAGVLSVEVAGPGFLNFRLDPAVTHQVLREVASQGSGYGRSSHSVPGRTLVEFVSANPTGPLHVGHGRGAALGDAIASLLEWSGERVQREYYYNDSGAQIDNLVSSVQARLRELMGEPLHLPPNGYHGEYVRELALSYREAHPDDARGENRERVRVHAVDLIRAEQDRDLRDFGVFFDIHFLESSLYDDGRVRQTIEALESLSVEVETPDGSTVQLPATYRTIQRPARDASGALTGEWVDEPLPAGSREASTLWLRTTSWGDDKDRVMVRMDGSPTYFLPDVAYHVTKWERGATRAVNIQGADHHGTIARVRAGLQALDVGIPEGFPEYVLHQMVTVMQGGEEVRLSKRAGSYVTLRDLIDGAGRDAVRFFFLMRRADSPLVFDLDLARTQSEENPVYYVQMAHARLSGIFRKGGVDPKAITGEGVDLQQLTHPDEVALSKSLAAFPEVLRIAARELEPHRVVAYLLELSRQVHGWYHKCPVLSEGYALRKSRLLLARAAQIVLANACHVLGIEAPEQMLPREEPAEQAEAEEPASRHQS